MFTAAQIASRRPEAYIIDVRSLNGEGFRGLGD